MRKVNLGLAFSTRRESIKNELEKARQERDAALAKLKEVEERLAGLNDQIASIKENSKHEAAAERERIAQSTKEEIAKLSAQGQREIESAARTRQRKICNGSPPNKASAWPKRCSSATCVLEDDARLIAAQH